MQIILKDLNKSTIVVITQGLDDLWVLYNIIRPGDLVSSRTTRRVVVRDGDQGDRKPMILEIRVESVEFHEYSNRLRLKGQITSGPEDFVQIGQYHTLNIETGSKLTIIKEKWFTHELQRLEKSTGSQTNKIVLAIAIETGLATIGLISNYSLKIASSVRHNIPGKRYAKQGANEELEEFYQEVNTVVKENLKSLPIQLITIMGPGFTKEDYYSILKESLKKEGLNCDIRVLSASSGTDSAIYEVLRSGEISKIITDHKMSQETGLMEEFISRMGRNNGLFTYGLNDTLQAAEMGAIEKLMVTDILMRTIGSEKQNAIEKLFTLVENSRGEINILSSSSPAGDQLQKFGGIASLLRFRFQ